MSAVEAKDLAYSYLDAGRPVLTVLSLSIEEGETVLVTGKSGGGKSTLVNCINGVIPHIFRGNNPRSVRVYGQFVRDVPLPKLSTTVGTLLQDPETQILNYTVEEEVAFGPENLCLPEKEIVERVEGAMETTGIHTLKDRETYALSGGELQRVALAAVLSMGPRILILDEPTSNIDPEGTAHIFETLKNLKEGRTLIIVEHKLERVLPFVDRVILVDGGKVISDVRKSELVDHLEEFRAAGIDVPETYFYAKKFGLRIDDLEGIRRKLEDSGGVLPQPQRAPPGKVVLKADSKVTAAGRLLLDAGLELHEGHTLAIMGRNGAGKSTLLKAMMGFLDKDLKSETTLTACDRDLSHASIQERGRYIAFMPQNFDLTLISKSVQDEIAYSLKKRGVKDYKPKVDEFLKLFSLERYRKSDPVMLSVGQRRRVAMAAAISSGSKIVMLDEPTSGQDFYHKEMLAKELTMMKSLGYSFIIVTHDAKFVYKHADRLVVLDAGHQVLEGVPEEVFSRAEKYSIIPPPDFYLSSAAQTMRTPSAGA